MNGYGLVKMLQPPKKNPTCIIIPLKVVNEEKNNNCYLLYRTIVEKMHFTYILSNCSRLIRPQRTGHREKKIVCKRCFSAFDSRKSKFKLHGQDALDQLINIS